MLCPSLQWVHIVHKKEEDRVLTINQTLASICIIQDNISYFIGHSDSIRRATNVYID